MLHSILSEHSASITELKANPMQAIEASNGEPIAILNRNAPAFYCVPPETYAHMMELLEDAQLAQLVRARAEEKEIPMTLDAL